jgi:hypothetical protein
MVEERMSHEFWQTLDQDTVFRTLYTLPGADYYAGYDPASGDDMVGSNGDFERTPTSRGGGAKVPVDFMLYLYPAMHYCSANCDRTSSGNIMQTFESADGLYGDPSADNRPGDGLPGPGTGQCKICGGGGSYTNVLGDSGMVRYPRFTKPWNLNETHSLFSSSLHLRCISPITFLTRLIHQVFSLRQPSLSLSCLFYLL